MDPALVELLAPLRAHPRASALLFDFDGTLSPMVTDPASARPAPGVVERLDALASVYASVTVVSGRPVAFLEPLLPSAIALSGLYGLESRIDGRRGDHPEAARWRPIVASVVDAADRATAPGTALHGALVEPKGLSITIHTRTRPDLEPAAAALAADLAAEAGLEVRPAKCSVELHPPIAADKGSVVRQIVAGRRHALFVGDDVGDLPAFDALAALAAQGALHDAVALAVGGPELPAAVAERVDRVLADQAAVVDLLDALVP